MIIGDFYYLLKIVITNVKTELIVGLADLVLFLLSHLSLLNLYFLDLLKRLLTI